MSIIPFGKSIQDKVQQFMDDLPEIDELTADELQAYQQQVHSLLEALDGAEPKNETSEEYDLWAQMHEDLEDVLDEILDALEV